jgi:hypothetical protein
MDALPEFVALALACGHVGFRGPPISGSSGRINHVSDPRPLS